MNDTLLDEIEKDILRESLNLGVGRAAAALSQLIDQEVEIYLPELDLLPKRQAVDQLSDQYCTALWAMRQYFRDTHDPARLAGHIFLFLQDRGDTTPIHHWIPGLDKEGSDTLSEQDVFQEIGNILLNACLSGLADLLAIELESQPLTVHRTDLRPLLLSIVRRETYESIANSLNRRRSDADQDPVIQMQLRFDTHTDILDGAVMIFLDLMSIPRLKQGLHDIASQLG